MRTSATTGEGLGALRAALLAAAPADYFDARRIVGDLVDPGELVVLVVPIDKEAPKGRLILPQVQTIRDLLDSDAFCMVVKERELRAALDRLTTPPALVVTDSQAFLKVAADTPPGVPMTSFSILFARFQGDLTEMVRGTLAIEGLRPGDRVLIAESCTHHPIGEDIGRVKIPRWLAQYTGGQARVRHRAGARLPGRPVAVRWSCTAATAWATAARCSPASCAAASKACRSPTTASTIAYSLGIFERALAPFPAALEAFRAARPPGPGSGVRGPGSVPPTPVR